MLHDPSLSYPLFSCTLGCVSKIQMNKILSKNNFEGPNLRPSKPGSQEAMFHPVNRPCFDPVDLQWHQTNHQVLLIFCRLMRVLELGTVPPFQDVAPAPVFADGKCFSVSLSPLCRSCELRLVYFVDKLTCLPMLQVVGRVLGTFLDYAASYHKNMHGTSSINNAQREYLDIPYKKHSNV